MNALALILAFVPSERCLGIFYGQPSAVIHKDQLLCSTMGNRYSLDFLYRGQLDVDRLAVKEPMKYDSLVGRIGSYQAKLEARDNRLLIFNAGSHARIFPLVDLQLLEYSEFGKELLELRGYPNWSFFSARYTSLTELILFPPHRAPDVPVPEIPVPPMTARSPEKAMEYRIDAYVRSARFDLQIAGPNTVRLFHAHKDRLFVSTELDFLSGWYFDDKGNIAKNPHKPPDRELRAGKLPAGFTETFAAYTAGKRDYLVTNNGKVYLCVPKGKDGVEVTSVWDDPKQRIVGVVQDPANDAVYGWGFAGADGSADRFYVRLDPKPVAVPYTRTVPLWNDRSDAYLESYECARAFRKAAEK